MNHVIVSSAMMAAVAGLLLAQDPPRKPDAGQIAAAHLRGAVRCKASQLIGCGITNSKNEKLGEIQDIVLDSGNRRIAYAVVGFGGFLGMGEKYFAMPWRLIEVDQRGTEDAPRATLGLDKAALQAAPGFDKASWPDMADPAWARQVDDYYKARNENKRPAGADEPKGSGVEGKHGADQAPASQGFTHRRLSTLIGMEVVDGMRYRLAEVEDLIVDCRAASIDAMLLSFGGTLGIGEKLVLVPSEALRLDENKRTFVFACTTADLESMAMKDGKMPALNNEDWLKHGREQCLKFRVAAKPGDGDLQVADAAGSKSVAFADAYDPKKVETVVGTITTIGSVCIGDLAEVRVRLRVKAADGHEVIVYAAPAAFPEQKAMGLRAGKPIEVTGSPMHYGTQTVLVAGSIVSEGVTARLRDAEGRPNWLKP